MFTIKSTHPSDAATLARLAPSAASLCTAAGLVLDLAGKVYGELSLVDATGRNVPIRAEIERLRDIRAGKVVLP